MLLRALCPVLVGGYGPFVPVWGLTLGPVGLFLLRVHGSIANLVVS